MKRHTSHRYGIKRRKNRKGSSLPLLYLEFFFSLGNTLFFSLISPFRQTRISPPSSCLPVSPFLPFWHGSLVCSPSFLRGRKEGKVCGIRQPNNPLHVTSYNACNNPKSRLKDVLLLYSVCEFSFSIHSTYRWPCLAKTRATFLLLPQDNVIKSNSEAFPLFLFCPFIPRLLRCWGPRKEEDPS